MKAVIIDDEQAALRSFQILLNKYPDIIITGIYNDPFEAIKQIKNNKPDVVFIDINMPQMNGLNAATCIMDESPSSEIVFVTAYDEYAIEAFELHAIDYLLKPVEEIRLCKTVARLKRKITEIRQVSTQNFTIRCFGCCKAEFAGGASMKFRAEKTKELFAYLLLNAGRDITKEELFDMLWPLDDPDKAIRQLYNGIYYIRKSMDDIGISKDILSVDSRYHLRIGTVDYDVAKFCSLFNITQNRKAVLEEMESLYLGDYLEGCLYEWAYYEREKLQGLYIQCAIELSKIYIEEKCFNKAEILLLKAYKKNSYEESITELLLTVYKLTKNKTAAGKHYKEYSVFLKKELNILPDKNIKILL
jgi:two-component SAPR family response regulator